MSERIPIRDLKPGDQFRLSAILPTLTVERIKHDEEEWGTVKVAVREPGEWPIYDDHERLVHLVKRGQK